MATLSVGLSQVDITPPLGTELCGFGPYLERRSEKVLEPLSARTCLFKLGRTTLALVSLDLVGIRLAHTRAIRKRVTRSTGIPGKNVMLCCTHSHSGPATGAYRAWGEPNPAYLRKLPGLVARGIIEANERFRPATLSYAEATLKGLAVNRVSDPKYVDDRLVVLRIDSDSETVAFLAHSSIHPVVLASESRNLCGDFVGLAINAVARDFPGSVGLYVQGACGDINVADACRPLPEAMKALQRHSRALAGAIRRALNKATPLRVDRLKATLRAITLPQVRTPAAEAFMMYAEGARMAGVNDQRIRRWGRFLRDAYAEIFRKIKRGDRPGLRTELQGFAIGRLLILAQPSELYFTFYERLRRTLRGRKLIFAGYTNDTVGYVPDRKAFEITSVVTPPFGTYAPYMVPIIRCDYRFREDVGDVLFDRVVGLSKTLTRKG